MNRKVVGVIVAYFLIYVVWGSTYFFIGVALKDFSPFLLGALRFTAAGLILLGICYLRGEQIFKKSLVKSSAISGIVLLFVDMAVVMLAQRYLLLLPPQPFGFYCWISRCGALTFVILSQS